MDFTRQPIIETVITPKEGCKLVVRSSKSSGQDEYFVDSVEVVSFGQSVFFRSLEKPKSFLVPASDYELLEVREAKMVLKNVGIDRSIKIGGGREAPSKPAKEIVHEKLETEYVVSSELAASVEPIQEPGESTTEAEVKPEKKRERRRHYRRRRGKEESLLKESEESQVEDITAEHETEGTPELAKEVKKGTSEPIGTAGLFSSLLPPPPTLISETIARYKDNATFKGAFFVKKEEDEKMEEEEMLSESSQEDLSTIPLEELPLFSEPMTPIELEETPVQEPPKLMEASENELDPK